MRRMDAFAVLGLGPGADRSEIRAAFRRLVHQRHPDTSGLADPGKEVHEVIEAYRLLMDDPSAGRLDVPVASVVDPQRRAVPSICGRCGGAGRTETVARCDACGGEGWITAIDVSGASRSVCRRCGGRGLQRSSRACRTCAGSGIER